MNYGFAQDRMQDQMADTSGLTLEQQAAALKAILTRHGPDVLEEPQRFENLLLDTTLSPAERAVIEDAAKLRIPQRILAHPDSKIPAAMLAHCVDQLSQSMALRSDAARDAVEIWISALGREVPAEPALAFPAAPARPRQPALPGLRKRLLWLLPEIKTRDQALAIIRTSVLILLGVAAFDLLLALWKNWTLLTLPVFFAIGALALYRFNSRIAAVTLLSVSCVIFILGGIGVLVTVSGDDRLRPIPTEVWISIAIAVSAALRATVATFKLRHLDQ